MLCKGQFRHRSAQSLLATGIALSLLTVLKLHVFQVAAGIVMRMVLSVAEGMNERINE